MEIQVLEMKVGVIDQLLQVLALDTTTLIVTIMTTIITEEKIQEIVMEGMNQEEMDMEEVTEMIMTQVDQEIIIMIEIGLMIRIGRDMTSLKEELEIELEIEKGI